MATSNEFIEYVCEQIQGSGELLYRKMFGEYMVYVNEKPILLVCDSTVYVKKLDCIADIMEDATVGIPYTGAKEHYVLDIDNQTLSRNVIDLLEPITPLPRKKQTAK